MVGMYADVVHIGGRCPACVLVTGAEVLRLGVAFTMPVQPPVVSQHQLLQPAVQLPVEHVHAPVVQLRDALCCTPVPVHPAADVLQQPRDAVHGLAVGWS